jgi:hypothetical protein
MGKETFGGTYFVPDRVKPDDARAGVTVHCDRIDQAWGDVCDAVFRKYALCTALAGGLVTAAYGATFGPPVVEVGLQLFTTVFHRPEVAAVLESPLAATFLYIPVVTAAYVGEVFPHSPLAASAGNALMIWGGIQVGRFVVR